MSLIFRPARMRTSPRRPESTLVAAEHARIANGDGRALIVRDLQDVQLPVTTTKNFVTCA